MPGVNPLSHGARDPEGLLRTVVAFANTAGGVVLLGAEDGTRHVRGIANPVALEDRIASLITVSGLRVIELSARGLEYRLSQGSR